MNRSQAVAAHLAQIAKGTMPAPGNTALPRDPSTFEDGGFAPSRPTSPSPVDFSPRGFMRPQPRRNEYSPVWNAPTPPGFEGTKLASFAELRYLSRTSTFARMCIERLITEILGLDWDIVPTDTAEKLLNNNPEAVKEFEDRREKMLRWWRRPDPEFDSFYSFFRICIEEAIITDSLSLYLVPTRLKGRGLMGSDLHSLMWIDGSTIKPLLDLQGNRPTPPNVAFQQFIYGVPRTDLQDVVMQSDVDDGETSAPKWRGDQMLYLPTRRNPGAISYGFSLVESALTPIRIELAKQSYVLKYYSEGNVPPGFLAVGGVETPDQGRQWQEDIDAKAGDLGARSQITVVPKDSRYVEAHTNAFNDAYDFANKEEILGNFGYSATDFGLLPGGKGGGIGGGKEVEENAKRRIRTVIKPLLQFFIENLFNPVIQQVAGQGDMQWIFTDLIDDSKIDKLAKWMAVAKDGGVTYNQARRNAGFEPYEGIPLADTPVIVTATGVVPLSARDAAARSLDARESGPSALETASSLSEERAQEDGVGESVQAAKARELKQLRAYLRHGRDVAKFKSEYLTPAEIAAEIVR